MVAFPDGPLPPPWATPVLTGRMHRQDQQPQTIPGRQVGRWGDLPCALTVTLLFHSVTNHLEGDECLSSRVKIRRRATGRWGLSLSITLDSALRHLTFLTKYDVASE